MTEPYGVLLLLHMFNFFRKRRRKIPETTSEKFGGVIFLIWNEALFTMMSLNSYWSASSQPQFWLAKVLFTCLRGHRLKYAESTSRCSTQSHTNKSLHASTIKTAQQNLFSPLNIIFLIKMISKILELFT